MDNKFKKDYKKQVEKRGGKDFVRMLHDSFYAKRKNREMRKEQEAKQMDLFPDMKRGE